MAADSRAMWEGQGAGGRNKITHQRVDWSKAQEPGWVCWCCGSPEGRGPTSESERVLGNEEQ